MHTRSRSSLPQSLPRVLLIIVFFIGTLLRIWRLGGHNLWHDEALSYFLAFHGSLSLSKSLEPPLYFLILKAWLYLVPAPTEFWMRLPSVFFSACSILLFYRLAKRLLNEKLALISSFILSLSPFHIWYAQEARPYALYIFEVLAATDIFLRALEEDKLKLWLGFIVLAVAALYTNYFILLFLVSQSCILIAVRKYRKRIIRWLGSCAIVFFAFLPSLVKLCEKIFFVKEGIWWINLKLNLKTIFITFKNFLVGYNARPDTFVAVALFLLLLTSFGLYYLFKERRDVFKLLLSLTLVPILMALLLSKAGIFIYLDRQLMAFSPFYYMILAFGVTRLPRRAHKVIVIVIYLFFVGSSLSNYYRDIMPPEFSYHVGAYTKKPIKPIADFIKENYKKDDMIAFSNPIASFTFWYYWSKAVKRPVIHYLSSSRSEYLYKYYSLIAANKKGDENFKFCYDVEDKTQIEKIKAGRVWLVNSSWGDEDVRPQVEKVAESLKGHYRKILEKEFQGGSVILFERMQ